MKKVISLVLFVLVSFFTYGQTPNTNYKHTVKYKIPVTSTLQIVTDDEKTEQIVYFDGLGRPVQAIVPNVGGNHEEIISHFEYDDMGRQVKNYLPYATNTVTNPLDLVSGVSQNLGSYYQGKFPQDLNPYSETVFENSPAGKVLKQAAPGNDWKINLLNPDHTVKFGYGGNLTNEVYRFDVVFIDEDVQQPKLIFNGYYAQDELFVQTTKNENWVVSDGKSNTTETFKDKSGKVLLVRTYDKVYGADVAHNTYYVYDDFGNLTYVVSPKGATEILVLNTFSNFTGVYPADIFKSTGRGVIVNSTGDVTATVSGLNLTVAFNTGYSSGVQLKTGYIVQLATSQPIPDMYLGLIGQLGTGAYGGVEYRVYIKNGFIYIEGSGNLSSVTQTFNVTIPEYSVNDTKVDDLCYQYKFDNDNRMMEKRIPGKGWESVVYDKLNRPVLTQDPNLKSNNKWLFVKYDDFGRVIYTGEYSDSRTRQEIQSNSIDFVTAPVLFEIKSPTPVTIGDTSANYTNTAFPNTSIKLNSVVYYDNYNFDKAGLTVPSTIYSEPVIGETKTLITGTKVRTLTTTNWTTSVMFYDKKARPISVKSKNDYLQTTNEVETKLDFVGNAIENKTIHTKTGVVANLVTFDYFTYDHAGRLVKQTQKIGSSAEELISYNKYDDLGKLVQQKVGAAPAATYVASAGLQTIDYGFNIRGWLTKINDPSAMGSDLFAYEIKYNNPTATGTALYNGNISQTFWKTANDNKLRNYSYSYDNLNRIKRAQFYNSNDATQNNSFNLERIDYDKNGNILFMHSAGDKASDPNLEWMDYMTYEYNGNQLERIVEQGHGNYGFIPRVPSTDTDPHYNYDANGNLIEDRNKDISTISYNNFNQPLKITFNGTNKHIDFVYNAGGVKESKAVVNGSNTIITYYAGGYTYQKLNGNAITLQYIAQAQGYAYPDGGPGTYKYVYQYKDQVGNVRLSYTNGTSGVQIVEESNYSPFGMLHTGYNNVVSSLGNTIAQKLKFNGKENEESLGLNVTEMDFRQYDAVIGRFYNIDLMSESSYGVTPFHFAGNNPIVGSDPSGLKTMYQNPSKNYAMSPAQQAAALGQAFGNSGFLSYFGNTEGSFSDNLHYGGPGGSGSGNGGPAGYGFGTGYNGIYQDGFTAALKFGRYQFDGHFERAWNNNNGGYVNMNGEYDINKGGRLDEIVIKSNWEKVWVQNGFDFKKFNTALGAFDFGSGVKDILIDYAVASSTGTKITKLTQANYINTLGKIGTRYSKGLKIFGAATFVVSSAISVNSAFNYYNEGGVDSSVGIKAGLDVAMGVVGFMGPIGFGISAAYFVIDASTDGFGGYGDPTRTK